MIMRFARGIAPEEQWQAGLHSSGPNANGYFPTAALSFGTATIAE